MCVIGNIHYYTHAHVGTIIIVMPIQSLNHTHTTIKPHPHTGRIIVGAPRGTFPGGLDLDAASTPENQTGLVYDCPVSRGSCGRLGDGTGLSEKLFDPTRKEGGKGEGKGRKEGERREREVGKREREREGRVNIIYVH